MPEYSRLSFAVVLLCTAYLKASESDPSIYNAYNHEQNGWSGQRSGENEEIKYATDQHQFCVHPKTMCGDDFCCCQAAAAVCSGQRLSYIPHLPEYIAHLDFRNNSLGKLEEHTLRNVTSLVSLNLEMNHLTYVHNASFRDMSLLKLLKIGDNHLKDFGDLVLALEHSHSLKNLSADHNEFKKMNLTHIVKLTNLWHLDLSWNKISVIQREVSDREFEVRSGLVEKESNLEILYLGTNLLTSFPNFCREDDPHVSFLPKLRELGIQWNCITAMLPHEMKCLKNLLRLNMDGNAVHHIHANFFQRFPALEHLSLKFCMSRKIDSHAFNHSNVKHLDVSENLWFFDRFYGLGIDPGLFLDMPQLRFVNMSWTVFRFSEYDEREEVLSSISHVTHLSLEGTGLDFIPRTILRDFTHLHYLDYSKNDLTNLPDDTFDNLTQLHKLNLNQNHLTTFTPALLQHVLSHDNVTLDLSGNPYSCTCDLLWFIELYRGDIARGEGRIFQGDYGYICSDPDSQEGLNLADVTLTQHTCMFSFITCLTIVSLSAFTIALLVVGVLVYRFRWRLRFFLYTLQHRLTRERHSGPEPVPKYDAFVSYDSDDNDWVLRVLRPELEDCRGLRLCLHERDFTPGRFISDNIIEHMGESGAILPVLSNAFLHSDWCRFELFVAVKSGLAHAQRRVPVVPVLLEELDRTSMDSLVYALLNTTTYLAWPREDGGEGERRRFWDTLCQVLTRSRGGSFNDFLSAANE